MIRKPVIAVLAASLLLYACEQTQNWGGGETLGQYGHSKDNLPDLHQMVVDAMLEKDRDEVF